MEILLVILVAVALIVVRLARRNRKANFTPYDGTDAWKEGTGHLAPTEKQLEFIADLQDEIEDLNEERDSPARLPRRPRGMDRAAASEQIDRLIAVRDRLEAEEVEREMASMPTRYRPASIGTRGGVKLVGPDPICTDLEEAKRHLAGREIAPRRIPCVVSDETGGWKPVWTDGDTEAT